MHTTIPDWLFTRTVGASTSLAMSTDLMVVGRWGAVRLWRRCSPYASHRAREFFAAPTLADGLLFANSRYAVATTSVDADFVRDAAQALDLPLDLSGADSWSMVRVPVLPAMARPLWDLARDAFGGGDPLQAGGLVPLYVLCPVLRGWDDDGAPVFLEHPEQEQEQGPQELEVVAHRGAPADWDVGYLRGAPAVGRDGSWYLVPESVPGADSPVGVGCPAAGLVWYQTDSVWEATTPELWGAPATPSDVWAAGATDYVAPAAEDPFGDVMAGLRRLAAEEGSA